MGLTLFYCYNNTGKSKLYLPSYFSKAQSFIRLIVPFWLKKILSHSKLQYWANKDRWLEAKYFDLKTRHCRWWCFLDDINELWLLKREREKITQNKLSTALKMRSLEVTIFIFLQVQPLPEVPSQQRWNCTPPATTRPCPAAERL